MRRIRAFVMAAGATAAILVAACHSSSTPPRSALLDRSAVRYRYAASPETQDDDAVRILETRHRGQPSSFDAADLAELYYKRGDHDASERLARESLRLLDAPNPARLTLAKLANVNHDFHLAIVLANKHLATRGANPRAAHIAIATAQLALGDLERATEAANAALSARPDTTGYLTRALVMQARGRDLDAASDFARAAATEQPGDRQGAARLRALWARFLIRRAAFADAAFVLDEALRIVPDLPIAIAQRGELALRTNKPAEAARLFERAYARSHEVRYLIDEARARELAGEREKAEILRDRIERIVRDDPRAHRLDLVEVLVDAGTPRGIDEAIGLATDEVSRRGSADVRYQLARALARAGRFDDAATHLDAALARGTREAPLFALAALVETRRGNTQRAHTHARAAKQLDPFNTVTRRSAESN